MQFTGYHSSVGKTCFIYANTQLSNLSGNLSRCSKFSLIILNLLSFTVHTYVAMYSIIDPIINPFFINKTKRANNYVCTYCLVVSFDHNSISLTRHSYLVNVKLSAGLDASLEKEIHMKS